MFVKTFTVDACRHYTAHVMFPTCFIVLLVFKNMLVAGAFWKEAQEATVCVTSKNLFENKRLLHQPIKVLQSADRKFFVDSGGKLGSQAF